MLQPAPSLTPEIAALLARAMFPDLARIARTLETYRTDPARRVFIWEVNGEPVSAVGLVVNEASAEVLHIGTRPESTGNGHGRQLLFAVADHLHLWQLTAETDDDSVEFYRRCGFRVCEAQPRGERRRFRCGLSLHPA